MSNKREYEIPEGYEARIDGNKVIIEKKESEDERLRKELIQRLEQSLNVAQDQEAHGCDRTETIEAYKWGLSLLHKMEDGDNEKPAQWKPTAAQMHSLKEHVTYGGMDLELATLYEDLTKLL